MDIGMALLTLLAFGVGLVLLYLLGWLLLVPLKWILKLIFNGIIGGIILWILNIFGSTIGVNIALNPLNAVIVGFFGIPGVIMILLLQSLL